MGRLSGFLRPRALPGWLLVGYQVVDALGNIQFVWLNLGFLRPAWEVLTTPIGRIGLTSVGLAWIWLASRNRQQQAEPFADGDVQDGLTRLGFNPGDVRQHLAACVDRLRDHGILDKPKLLRFLADRETRQALEEIYRGCDLERTVFPLDPFGYCAWGPILHRASAAEEGLARQHIRDRVREVGRRTEPREAAAYPGRHDTLLVLLIESATTFC